MTEILTSAQMRAIEAEATASGRVTGLDLMERKGAAVVEAICAQWPSFANPAERPSAAILCGPGHTGGAGFVVARLLHERGWRVDAFLYPGSSTPPLETQISQARWNSCHPTQPLSKLREICDIGPWGSYDIFVEAAFGFGFVPPLPQEIKSIFVTQFCGELAAVPVAIDIPSGLCADTGQPIRPDDYPQGRWPALDGLTFEASLTVTFHALNPGHVEAAGPQYCGQVIVKPIGL